MVIDPADFTLFAPVGPDAVRSAFLGGEPFVVHGEAGRLPAWMQDESLCSVEAFLARYTGRIIHGRRDVRSPLQLVENGSASPLLAAGEALYLPDLSDAVPASVPWLRRFEAVLGIPQGTARATAWVAPAGEGTALHLDAEDVVSVQLLGAKHFEVAEPAALPFAAGYQYGPGLPAAADLYPQAAGGFPDPAGATFTDVEMAPGSVLVLPRGHWHRTRCRTTSLAVSIVVSPPLLMDWALGVMRHRALEEARWRRPLYGAPTPGELQALSEEFSALATGLATTAFQSPWCEETTLQWNPSKRVDGGDSPVLVDGYDGRRHALTLSSTVRLAAIAAQGAAFTVREARARWGASIEADLRVLVDAGALYCWPFPVARRAAVADADR